ncbi:hypothetical protein, variant 1 [Aphanomyces invadans]|uniref:Calpain catalytic domain-containing protein n=1 Tax=Aphanomyces invadans TaxID=157072 RepID=A0A024TDP2_9STRA|nr:hypothetical protein, variant 1 [Aphanomyces invadans]ETV92134.1 hypothetical protein, variant 1 [Aphanomyces invadans]|eukprot:XP_008879296.1 hypothetical protein, variant 1 [Aphanomyces invadans]
MDITDGIVCVTKLTELPWRLDYTIENTTAHAYEVDLDFAGSSNLVVVREDSLVFRGSLRPYARVTTAIVRVHPAERCAVCVNYYVRRIEEAAVDSLDDSALDQAGTATDDACIDAFFHDPTFPPTPTCLGELGGAPATKRLVPTLTWTHLSSLYPSSWTIFPRSPTIPTSTLCGGDPTLVSADTRSALQFIGSRPSFLTALFSQTNGVNGHDHRYVVCLHHDGKPVRVTVDGYVPCFGQTGGPVLMKCISGHLWPLLLHKALAKLYGGYVPMFQVSALQLLEDIFGYPSVDVCAVGARATTIAAVANLLRQGHLVGVTVSASSGSRHGLLVNANPSTGLTIRSYPADQALRSDIITTVALQDIPSALRAWWCFPQLSRPQQVVRRCFVVDATACTSASAAMFAWSIPSPCTVMVSATYDQHVHDAGISILHVSPSNHLTPVKATSTKQGIRARSCSVRLLDGMFVHTVMGRLCCRWNRASTSWRSSQYGGRHWNRQHEIAWTECLTCWMRTWTIG